MIPVLYVSNIMTSQNSTFPTSISSLDIVGYIADAISCEVTEERNGVYDLVMEYPQGGQYAAELVADMVIGVDVRTENSAAHQAFRIYDIVKTFDGRMTIYAHHVSYQYALTPWYDKTVQGYMWDQTFQKSVTKISNSNPKGAIEVLNQNLSLFNDTFSSVPITSDITTTLSTAVKFPPADLRSIRNCIGGQSGSLIDIFGGELEFDNLNHIYLNSARGTARDFYIRYGMNIIDATMEENAAECYTGVIATWRYTDPETSETMEFFAPKEAANVASFPVKRWFIYDCTGNENLQNLIPDTQAHMDEISAKLQGLANTKAADILVGEPRVSIDVNFADIFGTEEYKNFRGLEQFYLCDTVHVVIPRFNVEKTAKITSITWDVLHERYLNMHIGEAGVATLADTLSSMGGGLTNVFNSVINEPYVAGTNIDITNFVISTKNIGDTVRASGSATVANNSTVTTHTISLSAGTWIVCGYIQWGSGFSASYNHNVSDGSTLHTVRNVGANGGGSSNVVILELTSTKTVTQSVYQSSGSSKNLSAASELRAIRIK